MRANESLHRFAFGIESLLGRSQHGDDRIVILDEDLAAEIIHQARHPWFDRPGRIHVATLKERNEFGVLRREHLGIAPRDGDIETPRTQPNAGFDVLRIAELRRRNATTAKISRCA